MNLKKFRWAQGLAGLLLAGVWFHACMKVEQGGRKEPLVKWLSLSALEKPAPPNQEHEKKEGSTVSPLKKSAETKASALKLKPSPSAEADSGGSPFTPPLPGYQPKKELKPAEKSWPDAGPQVIEALVKVLSDLERDWLGYRVNDLALGKVFDNGTSRQKGELAAVKHYAEALLELSVSDRGGARAEVRKTLLDADLTRFWFPPAEKNLREGSLALSRLGEEMNKGRVRIEDSPESLSAMLSAARSLLEEETEKLLSDDISFMKTDNVFYEASGAAFVSAKVVEAMKESFAAAVKEKKCGKALTETAALLEEAASRNPLLVMTGDPDDLRANHLAGLALTLTRAREQIMSGCRQQP